MPLHGDSLTRSALEEGRDESAALNLEVGGDVGEDPGESADAETRMVGDRDVMRAAVLLREAQVTAGFAGDLPAMDITHGRLA
jgi:hypothetical protein